VGGVRAWVTCLPDAPRGELRGSEIPVGAFLDSNILCVHDDLDLASLASLFMERGLSHVYVVDENFELVGVAREKSLLGAAHGGVPLATARDIAESADRILEGVAIRRALLHMAVSHVRQAPIVTKDGVLVGVLGDVQGLRWFAACARDANERKACASAAAGRENG
jgi:CBS domain-containing protein